MGERTSYSAGTFSWTDLTTTDQATAKAFYTELFGWGADDRPIGEGSVYSIMSVQGKEVAAISPQPQQQREAGAPPTWNSYVTVESADDSLARAGQLGATVHSPAFDVFDAGRMGVVQDPQGAFFAVWEPKTNIGAQLVNVAGALCWNELYTPDMDASAAFYADLFDWTTEPFEGAPMPYLVVKTADGHTNGGMTSMLPPGTPPHWLVYFGAESADAASEKVLELGGTRPLEPMDIGPSGRIAVVMDPQGAAFGLYSGTFEE